MVESTNSLQCHTAGSISVLLFFLRLLMKCAALRVYETGVLKERAFSCLHTVAAVHTSYEVRIVRRTQTPHTHDSGIQCDRSWQHVINEWLYDKVHCDASTGAGGDFTFNFTAQPGTLSTECAADKKSCNELPLLFSRNKM